MGETTFEIGLFKDALMDDNISVQVDAIKRLPSLAYAMEAERTRKELIPCIANCVDALPDETRFNLAEQLEKLVPLVGGSEHVEMILDILAKLACEDEVIVRDRAVETMKNICDDLNNQQCENCFYPLIENLIKNKWFATKCSAGCLIAICYSKMSTEKQSELRNYFRNLIQDESPMVRRSTSTSLVDLLPFIKVEEIKSEFVPIFDNLAQDEEDSVRTLAVDAGITMSKQFKDIEIYEFLLPTFRQLSEDESWRVRLRVAWKIHEIPLSEENRDEVINIYSKCVRDEEAEVRVFAAKTLYDFAQNLLESYKDMEGYEDIFEKNFEEKIVPEIYYMLRDPSDEVRVGLSTNILFLSSILRNECFNNNILPLVIDALENEEFMPFKENMLKNLNSLPLNVDITKSLKSIKTVLQNLLQNSQMHWRTRRNLLLAFMHISKNSTSEYFDKNLNLFYQHLLNDPIYAVRRTSSLILPLLIKQFGSNWAKNSLIPAVVSFTTDPRYLFRCIALFVVEELIEPTLDPDKPVKYLENFRDLLVESKDAVETLIGIIKLNEKLQEKLGDKPEEENDMNKNDNLQFYGEDTLENLKKEQKKTVFLVTLNELQDCYLEGVLTIILRDFITTIQILIDDPIENVRDRAKVTLQKIHNFSYKIKKESEESWVQETIKSLSKEELDNIDKVIAMKLVKEEAMEEVIEEMVLEENTTQEETTPEVVQEKTLEKKTVQEEVLQEQNIEEEMVEHRLSEEDIVDI